jgi:hypothetical protein
MSENLAIWAAKSLGSGIASQLGGYAATQVLVAVGISKDQDAEILTKLGQINQRLDLIVLEISRLSAQIDRLAVQLSLELQEIKRDVQAVGISDALIAIETAYAGREIDAASSDRLKTMAAGAPPTSLAEILRRRRQGENLSEAVLDEFARHVLVDWRIQNNVFAISRALAGDPGSGGADGLLWTWTELFTRKMGARTGSASLKSSYDMLEHNFLRYLGTQLLGVFLVASAKSRGSAPGQVAPEAAAFLDDYIPSLRTVLDRFLQCVERLVTQQCQFRAPAPRILQKTKMEGEEICLGVPEDVTGILLRSELVARLLLASMTKEKPGADVAGLFVHLFCRQRDLRDSQGPELNPWGNVKSTGRSLPGSGLQLPAWEASDSLYARLRVPEPADQLRLVRYFFPYTGVTKLTPSFYKWSDARRNVDLTNFNVTPSDQPEPASFAPLSYIADFERVRNPVPAFSGLGPNQSAWAIGNVEGARTSARASVTSDTTKSQHILQPADPYNRLYANFGVEETQEGTFSATTVSWRIRTPLFKYQGAKKNLKLHLWLSSMTEKGPWLQECYMAAQLVITLTTPTGNQKLFDTNEVDRGRMNLWDKWGPSQLHSEYFSDWLEFTVAVGDAPAVMDQFDLILEMYVRHQNRRPSNFRTKAAVDLTIKDLSVYWV